MNYLMCALFGVLLTVQAQAANCVAEAQKAIETHYGSEPLYASCKKMQSQLFPSSRNLAVAAIQCLVMTEEAPLPQDSIALQGRIDRVSDMFFELQSCLKNNKPIRVKANRFIKEFRNINPGADAIAVARAVLQALLSEAAQ